MYNVFYISTKNIVLVEINIRFSIQIILKMWPSKQKLALFTISNISRNTVLKYSVTSALYCACVLSSKIFSYLLVFTIGNLLYLWWLNFMAFLPSISAISISNRGDGWNGWWGMVGLDDGIRWGGVRQWGGVERGGAGWDGVVWEVANLLFGILHEHPRCPHSGQWHTSGQHSRWQQTLPYLCLSCMPLYQPWLWQVGNMPLRKADQLTFTGAG